MAVSALGILLGRLNKETELSVDVRLVAVVVGDVRARDSRGAVALRGHCVLVGHVLRPVWIVFLSILHVKKRVQKRVGRMLLDMCKRKDLVKDLLLDCGEHLGVRLVDDNVHGLPVSPTEVKCQKMCLCPKSSRPVHSRVLFPDGGVSVLYTNFVPMFQI